MQMGMARRACIAVVVAAAAAMAWSGLAAAVAQADGGPGIFAHMPGWAQHFSGRTISGRTISGPWGGGWRTSGPPAPTLNGDWAPFNRCPVDNPAMLAANGSDSAAYCIAVTSASGAIKIGNLALATGESDSQFGLVSSFDEGEETLELVAPPNGAMQVAPVNIPDGLTEMICPIAPQALRSLCGAHRGYVSPGLANIEVNVEQAGELSGFSLAAATQPEGPFIVEPVRIHLENALLGPRCYIGSESEPIVVPLEALSTPSFHFGYAEGNGTPLTESSESVNSLVLLEFFDGTDGDQSFAVPGVNGCGAWGSLDGIIDEAAGLPSPAGANGLVLDEANSYLTGLSHSDEAAPNDGQILSQDWHSAVVGGHWGHGH